MAEAVATCVWSLRADVLVAAHRALGAPDHRYPNGSQTWVRDGPGDVVVEWRLHPSPGFTPPTAGEALDLFTAVAGALATDAVPVVDPTEAWSGLEVTADDPEVAPGDLAGACGSVLGIAPDRAGSIDREDLGRAWERSGGRLDVIGHLLGVLDRP